MQRLKHAYIKNFRANPEVHAPINNRSTQVSASLKGHRPDSKEVHMIQRLLMTRRSMLFSLVGLVAMLTLWGCGSGSNSTGSYKTPVAPQPAAALETASKTALATADDVKAWIDSGLLNNKASGSSKLVILAVTDPANYLNGHIPGSQLLNSGTEINQTRLEGVAQIGTQVIDGTMIDPIIKRSGIDANTTVVFTVSQKGSFLNAARAYFIFRYWGFPKERLKILDGGDDAWVDKGYALTKDAPVITPSAFSVKNNTNNFHLRSSIGEMISLVDKINLGTVSTNASGIAILDVRGGNPAVYMANAKVDDFAQYSNVITGKTSTYKDAAQLKERFASFGVTAQNSMTYVYCASGTRASSTFFALDGILNWPVTLYDGSTIQWMAYYLNTTTAANNLPAASLWRVDINTPGTTKPRTAGAMTTTGTTALVLDPVALSMYSILDPRANQIRIADELYIKPVVTETPAAPPSGGGSASGC